jgi:hypothetical protein
MTATIHPFPQPARIWVAKGAGTAGPDHGYVVTREGVSLATYGRSWDYEWSWHLDERLGEICEREVLAVCDEEDAAWSWLQSWLTTQGYSDEEACEAAEDMRRDQAKAVVRSMLQRSVDRL